MLVFNIPVSIAVHQVVWLAFSGFAQFHAACEWHVTDLVRADYQAQTINLMNCLLDADQSFASHPVKRHLYQCVHTADVIGAGAEQKTNE